MSADTVSPERIDRYRAETRSMHFYSLPKMRVCIRCRRNRSIAQFTEGGKVCLKCRGGA